MSWDIYGNPLRRGYCEVHPDVHQEYPCSICMAQKQQQSQPHNELEQLQYEFAQQGDYIRHLESERAALSTQVESLLDDRKEFVKKEFHLLKEIERLEIELKKRDEQNAALAAQVEALQSRVGTAERVEAIFNQAPEISFDDCVKLFPNQLLELRAEAGRAGFIAGADDTYRYLIGVPSAPKELTSGRANQYADSIRQGGKP